jgi:hypothetical protein
MSSSLELLTLHQLNTRHQNLLKEINKVKNEIEKRQKEELKDPIKEDPSDKDPTLPELYENIRQNQVPELDKSKESSSTQTQKKVKVVVIKKKSETSEKLS